MRTFAELNFELLERNVLVIELDVLGGKRAATTSAPGAMPAFSAGPPGTTLATRVLIVMPTPSEFKTRGSFGMSGSSTAYGSRE